MNLTQWGILVGIVGGVLAIAFAVGKILRVGASQITLLFKLQTVPDDVEQLKRQVAEHTEMLKEILAILKTKRRVPKARE